MVLPELQLLPYLQLEISLLGGKLRVLQHLLLCLLGLAEPLDLEYGVLERLCFNLVATGCWRQIVDVDVGSRNILVRDVGSIA